MRGSEALPRLVDTVSDVRRGVLTPMCEVDDLDKTFGRLFIAEGGGIELRPLALGVEGLTSDLFGSMSVGLVLIPFCFSCLSSPSVHWRCNITDFVAHYAILSKRKKIRFTETHRHLSPLRSKPPLKTH